MRPENQGSRRKWTWERHTIWCLIWIWTFWRILERTPCCLLYRNAIFLGGRPRLVHRICSGMKGRLHPEADLKCTWCTGNTWQYIDGRLKREVLAGYDKLEVVPGFCYLGGLLFAGGTCKLAAVIRCKCIWEKFSKLLPLLNNRQLPLLTMANAYSIWVRSVMLYETATSAITTDTLNRIRRNYIHFLLDLQHQSQ